MSGKRILIAGSADPCSFFQYASTAVIYGKPRYSPIDEDHPLIVEKARKPLYDIA